MGRGKLKKFEDNINNKNVIEPDKANYDEMKGAWPAHFGNDNDIVLEVGCGKGEYTVGLGEQTPDKNFIGADIKGSRIWNGSTIAREKGLENVAFLRTRIEFLDHFFAPGEVSEIWITFPDPRPKDRDIKRRLTSPRFLNLYRTVLKSGGVVHLKTDNLPLFEYSLEVLEDWKITPEVVTKDLYDSPYLPDHRGVQTRFEKKFLAEGIKINYLRFSFD